jgi:hypothetical protein
MKITVLYDVTPCGLVDHYHSENYCPDDRYEIPPNIYQTARRHIAEDKLQCLFYYLKVIFLVNRSEFTDFVSPPLTNNLITLKTKLNFLTLIQPC